MKYNLESADICVMYPDNPYPVCYIEYYTDKNDSFYYCFMPYYDRINQLPLSIFHGIQGIDLTLKKKCYIRKNYVPSFISERAPIPTRTNLSELMNEAGITEYNPIAWLKHTKLHYFGDGYFLRERDENEYF